MKARQTVSFHLRSHLSCRKWQLGAAQWETLGMDRVELNTLIHNLQSIGLHFHLNYHFTSPASGDLQATFITGAAPSINKTQPENQKYRYGWNNKELETNIRHLHWCNHFYFSCIYSSVLMSWCIFGSVLLLFVLVVNHWSIHHIQPFIYYLLPGQKCLLNKMHFYYPKPSDQASIHVCFICRALHFSAVL